MKNFLKICGWVGLNLLLLGVAVIVFVFIWFEGFKYLQLGSTISAKKLPFAIVFEDKNGQEFYRSFGNQNREWVDVADVSEVFLQATVLSEDKRFYEHSGIDVQGISRAMVENFKAGYIKQGGSTLTQQIAKKAFLSDERTFDRKFKELFLSYGIEKSLSKDEILELYVNIAPYGATLSGVKSSAQFYFEKNPAELSAAESLLLSVIPKDPVRLTRKKNIKDWLGTCVSQTENCDIFSTNYEPKRLDSVLLAVAKKQNWSNEKILEIWEELKNKKLPSRQSWANDDFQHFRFYVKNFLLEKGFHLENFPGGLRIKTSIDTELQKNLLQYLRSGALSDARLKNGMSNNAVLLLENETRKPLVWIGSKDFWDEKISGQVDMLQSLRQTGSSIKPFIFAGFFEQGFGPLTTMWDTRVRFNGNAKIIQNSDGQYLGNVPANISLAQSRNVPAAQALYLAGGESKMKKFLDSVFGFEIVKNHKNHGFGWSLALGTAPIELKNLANGFATLATGTRKNICPIVALETMTGETIKSPCDKNSWKSLSVDSRALTLKTLSNPALRPAGPWRDNTTIPGLELAVKSGTSSKRIYGELYPVDNYLVGTNEQFTFLMWGGNTNGSNMEQGTFGTTTLGPHWKKMVEFVVLKYPNFVQKISVPTSVEKFSQGWVRKNKPVKQFKKIPGMSYVTKEENAAKKLIEKSGIELFLEETLSRVNP